MLDVECPFCTVRFKILFEYEDKDLLAFCPSCGSDIKNFEPFSSEKDDEEY